MKRIFPLLLCLMAVACSTKKEEGTSGGGGDSDKKVRWTDVWLHEGLRWRHFDGQDPVSGAMQVINVLELNLDRTDLHLSFEYFETKKKLSAVASAAGALAATNASFGAPHTFIRTGGTTWCDISVDQTDSNWWKHECAVWYDGVSTLGFLNYDGKLQEAVEAYRNFGTANLFSGSPMLIENGNFSVWDPSSANRKARAAREPRTVIALTRDRRLLLITIDGRWQGKSEGMTYLEMSHFLKINFAPLHAMNMDGGGSTAMYIKGRGDSKTHIVNYPCNYSGTGTGATGEGVSYDRTHERALPTFFFIKEVK